MNYTVGIKTNDGYVVIMVKNVHVIIEQENGWYFERNDNNEELTTLLFVSRENMLYYNLDADV